MPKLEGRPWLLSLCASGGKVIEIGVWQGNFSREILDTIHPSELHLVDPWKFEIPWEPDPRFYLASRAICKTFDDMDLIAENVRKRFAGDPRVIIHHNFSEKEAGDFADESFDWIYIDGCHSYRQVKLDLELYYPKVKIGGILCGDDYSWGPEYNNPQYPVKVAVNEFAADYHLVVNTDTLQGQWYLKRE